MKNLWPANVYVHCNVPLYIVHCFRRLFIQQRTTNASLIQKWDLFQKINKSYLNISYKNLVFRKKSRDPKR